MPRRPKGKSHSKKPRPLNREDGKLNRWNKFSDIPLDEEDQFHVNRDQILLNGEDLDVDDEGDEDEVFALNGMPASSSSDEEQDAEEQQDEQDRPTTSRKKQKTKGKNALPPPTSDSSENDNADESNEEETWGFKKSAYYSTNAAHFDSGDEEANELEEQEAKRLQTKTRDVLVDEDFGLADHVEVAIQEDIQDLIEPEPQVPQSLPRDKQSILRHLETTSPETLALARDWDDIARSVVKAGEKLKKMESDTPDAMCLGMVHLHYQTLLTYATTLAFYLYLRSSPKYATNPDLLNTHPILDRLLTLKQSLATLEDLDFDMSDDYPEGESEYDDDDDEDLDLDLDGINGSRRESLLNSDQPKRNRKKRGLELDELQELLKDAEGYLADFTGAPVSQKGKGKRKNKGSEESEPPKKKRKTDGKANKPSQPVFDLVEPEFRSSSNSKTTATGLDAAELDVYGEQMTLQSVDASDKKARRKSLRFHTAKIESAAGRKERGVKNAIGGDDDIPYKERKKQKEIRESKELVKKGRGEGGDDLSDTEPDAVNGRVRGKRKRIEKDDEGDNVSGGEGNTNEYYSLVQKRTKERKYQKKTEYEAARAAEKDELMFVDTSDGPRRLTSAILKNRGLIPHRSKSVRNPRVKKRIKFDKAKKKLGSQKAVYKGGVGDSGRYDGEKTGISKVVKAVKL